MSTLSSIELLRHSFTNSDSSSSSSTWNM